MRIACLAAVVALPLMAAPALACMPGGLTPAGPVAGAQCAVSQVADEFFTVGLGEARDFTAGVVVQRTFESNGCGSEQTLIVMLCGQDQAVVLGTEVYHSMLGPEQQQNLGAVDDLERWLRQATRRKMVPGAEVLASEARKRGLDLALQVPLTGKISMAGKRFGLACGCETYYPVP